MAKVVVEAVDQRPTEAGVVRTLAAAVAIIMALHLQAMQIQLSNDLSGGKSTRMTPQRGYASNITNMESQLIFVDGCRTAPGGISSHRHQRIDRGHSTPEIRQLTV